MKHYTVIQIMDLLYYIQVTLLNYKHTNTTFMKSFNLTCSRNYRNSGPFSGVIKTFSLDTEKLIEKYEDVELQLIFLKTEVKNENRTILFIRLYQNMFVCSCFFLGQVDSEERINPPKQISNGGLEWFLYW